jgi:hypothetical protein
VRVQLSAIESNNRFPGPVVVATYDMVIARGNGDADVPVADEAEPDQRGAGLVGIIANGYSWHSDLVRRDGKLVLDFFLTINPTVDPVLFPVPPAFNTTATTVHRWVTGDDGIVGWPPGTST